MTRRLQDPDRGRCRVCSTRFQYEPRPGPPPVTCSEECRKIRRRAQHRDDRRRWRGRKRIAETRILVSLTEGDNGRALGPHRILPVRDIAKLLDRHAKGWTIQALATAYGISTRTVQRYLELEHPERVRVGRYVAWFAASRVGPPVQLSEFVALTRGDRVLLEA